MGESNIMASNEGKRGDTEGLLSRRGLLVATGSVALAGCSALNTENPASDTENPASDTENQDRDPPTIEAGYAINGSTEYGSNITLNSTTNDGDEYLWEINNQTHTGEKIELEITQVGNISINHTVQRSLENGDTISDSVTQTLQDVGTIDPNLSFEELYEQSINTESEILTQEEISQVEQERTKKEQIERAANIAIGKEDIETLEVPEAVKEIAHNQLGYDTDQVLIDTRTTGGARQYGVTFTKEEGEWQKTLSRVIDFLQPGEEPSTNNEEILYALWDEEDLTQGAAMEIDAWRKGVEKGETRKDYDDQTWLGSSVDPDITTDSIVTTFEQEEAIKDWWGKIGYSRKATDIIDRISDPLERESFGEEVELVKNLSIYREAVLPDDNKKPVDEEKYSSVMTREELETELENGEAEKPLKLTETEETELYVATVDYNEHKEDAFNRGIPESLWPEKGYPEEGVELSSEFKERPEWIYREDGEE